MCAIKSVVKQAWRYKEEDIYWIHPSLQTLTKKANCDAKGLSPPKKGQDSIQAQFLQEKMQVTFRKNLKK